MTERTATILPQEVGGIERVFPANVGHLMPSMDQIPDEFKNLNHPRHEGWNAFVSDWFFAGIVQHDLTPRDGIDKVAALRHVRMIIGSFDPKHEHKEAACAYLMSLWFSRGTWTTKSGDKGSAK